ncbi:hypothetical protein Mal48_41190 [Thalassoglobus polymorphus]|uniref:Uncharacterized protein n=1 Tax=Thalassoglobus polymorphus TaxID=2527994 RepID=A0A517QT73_9PLAN|nr:hypothetical protein Mal48_41190 [Thalassoglobus polymorphus]
MTLINQSTASQRGKAYREPGRKGRTTYNHCSDECGNNPTLQNLLKISLGKQRLIVEVGDFFHQHFFEIRCVIGCDNNVF